MVVLLVFLTLKEMGKIVCFLLTLKHSQSRYWGLVVAPGLGSALRAIPKLPASYMAFLDIFPPSCLAARLKKGWQVPQILLLLPQVQLLTSNWSQKFYSHDTGIAKLVSFTWTHFVKWIVSLKSAYTLWFGHFWCWLMIQARKTFWLGFFFPC